MLIRIPFGNAALVNPSDDPEILAEFRTESHLKNQLCQTMLGSHKNQEFQSEFQFWPIVIFNPTDDHRICTAANTTVNTSAFY